MPQSHPFRLAAAAFAAATLSTAVHADLVISEVLYDVPGGDDGKEWVELFNSGPGSVDLATFSLGYGGTDYTYGSLQLTGTVAAGAYFVVGGAASDGDNGNPVYDQVAPFTPNLQNAGATADGVALFDVVAASITAATVPIDAVIYGATNDNNLLDESGSAGGVDVVDVPGGTSIERLTLAGGWAAQAAPTPNTGPLVPEPATGALALLGATLVLGRRRR